MTKEPFTDALWGADRTTLAGAAEAKGDSISSHVLFFIIYQWALKII